MLTPKQELEMMERIAQSNKIIGHVIGDPSNRKFFSIAIEELESDLHSRLDGVCMFVEDATDAESDELSDNPYITKNCAFWIIAPIKDPNDFDEIRDQRNTCYEACWQIYSMLRDMRMNGIYKGFQQNSFVTTSFRSMYGNVIGFRAQYRYISPAPRTITPSDWNDPSISSLPWQ